MEVELSVIIPTHNRPGHLARTLQALMAQAQRDFEVVVVADDCGADTFEVLDQTCRVAPVLVRVVKCVEHSAARSRNLGLAACSGRNCLFLDTDVLVPRQFTRLLSSASRMNPSAVLLTPLYGNAASSLTWPFLVNDGSAAEVLDCTALLEWASHQPKLRDVRMPFADPSTGSLDHLPAPWVFCWSSSMAVARVLIEEVGGFAESFDLKGSEDIELGIRLCKAGATFILLPNTYAFHLPHERDRTREESGDMIHARRLLATHTTTSVESFCAFDCENANPMIEILTPRIATLAQLAQHAASRSVRPDALCLQNPELVIGPPPSWLSSAPDNCRVVFPIPVSSAAQEQVPLWGFALPFPDQSFRLAVVTCLWQILPERLACRLFDEALRVAEQVYVLKDSALTISDFEVPPDRLVAHDTPYWERTHRLRRSFYDYRLAPLAHEKEILSYQLFRMSPS